MLLVCGERLQIRAERSNLRVRFTLESLHGHQLPALEVVQPRVQYRFGDHR